MQKQVEQTLTSLEVAEMVEKQHNELLKDIRRYVEQLGEGKIPQSDFFIESTYQNSRNKTMPCYNVTKRGCEFIANKLTGVKGTIFTAKFINRFHDMEEVLEGISEQKKEQKPNTIPLKEQLEAAAFIANDLHIPQSNKIMMFRKVCENNNINNNFLPVYSEIEDKGRIFF